MTAFGPYKDKVVIDFNELKDNKLFVISGNTGAGKTTIFDGICFALYGTASGQDRENNAMLRSDFAEDDTHTAVELEFELSGRCFRILRQLGHTKQGNRTKTGERYEFFEIINGQEIPCVDRQIVSEIDQKVETLMGLTQDQFKQIVMLPQGEFRKLLTSKTENKEDILRRLFKTEQYKQISERLRLKKDRVADRFNQEKQVLETYIQNIYAALPEREGAPVFQVLGVAHYNVNQVITGLEQEVQFYHQQIAVDTENYEKAYETHNQKQVEFHQGKGLNERFEELEQKEITLKKLQEQQPDFTAKQQELDAAERAGKLIPYEKQVTDWLRDEKEKESKSRRAEEAKRTADATLQKVTAIFEQEEGKQAEREDVRKKLDRLEGYIPVVKEVEEKKEQLKDLEEKGKNAKKHLAAVQLEIKQTKTTVETYQEQIKAIEQKLNQLPDKQKRLPEMREQVKVLIDYLKCKKKQTTLEKEHQQQQQIYAKQKDKYIKLEQSWLNNQASVLASHLHDGEACPVCGSLEHPQIALSEADNVTKEQLDAARKTFDESDGNYRSAAANLQMNTNLLKEKETEVTGYDVSLDEADEIKEKLSAEGKRLKEEVDQLETDQKQLVKLRESLDKTNDAIRKSEEIEKERDQAYQELKTEYRSKQAVYQDKLQSIPESLQVLAVLEKQIQETKNQKEKLEQNFADAQSKLQQAKEEQTKTNSHMEHIKQQLVESRTRREEAEQYFIKQLKNENFASKDTYQAAKLAPNEREALKTAIDQFKQNLSTTTEQVKDLSISLKGKEKVDLSAIQQKLAVMKETYETALNKRNQSQKYYQEATNLITNITETNNLVKSAEQQLGTISDLYDVLRGQNNQKVSFERYLQIEYLEQIIDSANHRLEDLSNGQFMLIRSDRQESHGRQSGLGLDVYDAYTGQTRDVKTLSGGEKFNASLCLALGMSDVIQSFQGNISIETMFIDEGFGSLDEESLYKSIDTLIDLQQTGRMIGVISHVQELKTVFPAVLEVKKSKEGYSQTKFVVK
jgi:exonuclease SbcC